MADVPLHEHACAPGESIPGCLITGLQSPLKKPTCSRPLTQPTNFVTPMIHPTRPARGSTPPYPPPHPPCPPGPAG